MGQWLAFRDSAKSPPRLWYNMHCKCSQGCKKKYLAYGFIVHLTTRRKKIGIFLYVHFLLLRCVFYSKHAVIDSLM